MEKPNVTLWALGPYLVVYRALGLIPIHFESSIAGEMLNNRSWRFVLSKSYSAVILLSVSVFLIVNQPSLLWFLSRDNHQLLEVAHRSSVCLNVFFISVFFFCYLGRRLCRLIDRMVRCERDLVTFDCHLSVNLPQLFQECLIITYK